MPESYNRNIKILGAAWLVLAGLTAVYAFANVLAAALDDNTPTATEVSDGYWVFVALAVVMVAVGTVSGWALLLRKRVARPILIVSSILLLPLITLLVPLLVVVPSLWLTLSRSGKETFASYMARADGEATDSKSSSGKAG